MTQPEPWLRGPLPGVNPLIANLFYTFTQAREELRAAAEGLTPEEIWSRPSGLASFGFHVRHMGGAAERLVTYVAERQLSEAQLQELKREIEPGATGDQLLAELDRRLAGVEDELRKIEPKQLDEPRAVGRARLPSTAIGLIVHIAEHTQRHLGQAVTTAKLIRGLRA